MVYKNYYDQSRFKNDWFRRFNSVEKKSTKNKKSLKIKYGTNYWSRFVQNWYKFHPSGTGKFKSWTSLSLQRGRSLINRFHASHIRIPKSVKTPGRSGPRQTSLTATTKWIAVDSLDDPRRIPIRNTGLRTTALNERTDNISKAKLPVQLPVFWPVGCSISFNCQYKSYARLWLEILWTIGWSLFKGILSRFSQIWKIEDINRHSTCLSFASSMIWWMSSQKQKFYSQFVIHLKHGSRWVRK